MSQEVPRAHLVPMLASWNQNWHPWNAIGYVVGFGMILVAETMAFTPKNINGLLLIRVDKPILVGKINENKLAR